ncbi:MAG: hypothetical protein J6S49_07980 [Erysipelotrichaceae bacterium]|nr:hypothetical protein [Erysipelotrichaceae bacterium]
MFKDIGNKMKSLAEILCILGIIASAIAGSVLGNFLIIIIGALASWLSSFGLYGFGELIDQTKQTREDIEEIKYYLRSIASSICGPNGVEPPHDPNPTPPPTPKSNNPFWVIDNMPEEYHGKKL